MPLVFKHANSNVILSVSNKSELTHPRLSSDNSIAEPVIRLVAIFFVDGARGGGATAIIEENGISRSVSTGEIVAGMKLLEIRRGEIILGKGDKTCIMTL